METEKTSKEYANWKAPETGSDDSAKTESQSPTLNQDVDIPQKYQGMPSEMVEEMWVDPQSVDESKNQQLAERRSKAIEAIKGQEQLREQAKTKGLEDRYSNLPEDQKKDFVSTQQEASQIIAQAIKGERQIDDLLSPEEQWIINKAKDIFEQAKEQNPDAPLTLQFSRPIDQTVYGNLVNRLTFSLLGEKAQLSDQAKANDTRKDIGIPEQQLDTTGLKLADVNTANSSPEQNQSTQADIENTTAAPPQSEQEGNLEKEQALKGQVEEFLKLVANDPGIRRTIDNFRAKTGTTETDMQILSKMDKSMYELIHKSGMSYQEVVNGINVPDKEDFVKTFNAEISGRLVDKVNQSSKVRHVTEQELIRGDQPDQAVGFVWFKGNAPRPANAREVRFYLNASPDGTPQVAEYLSKLSDQLDQYGMRLQFKFRKDLGEYDRTDTCVAYLYMPEAKTSEQKANSDQWLETVKSSMAQIPKEALRQKNSFFTEKIADGLSYTEDTREASSKKGESYTSQITKSISEACADVSGEFDTLTPEAMSKISGLAAEKLKALNYI